MVGAIDEVGLFGGDVGEGDGEDLAVVGGIDEDAIDHRPPVLDLRGDDTGLGGEAFDDGRADEVADLDDDFVLGPADGDFGGGGLVGDEFAVAGVGAQFDDFEFVGHVAAFAQPVPFFEPGVGGEFLAEADEEDVAFLVAAGLEFVAQLLQVGRAERMVERDDFDQTLALGAIEKGIALGALNADVFAGQGDRLVVLDLQIVVIDPVRGEMQGRRGGRGIIRRGLGGKELSGLIRRHRLRGVYLPGDDAL